MLLSPRNPLEASYQGLKVKVDDTEPKKYFICHSCSKGSDLLLSSFEGARCSCRKLMQKKMELLEESKDEASVVDGIFVKGDAMFLIFDDLTVLRSSPSDSVQRPLQLGHKNFSSKMEEKYRDVGTKEINPLNVLQEDDAPKYWCGTVADKDNEGRTMISKKNDMLQYPAKNLKLFEPRCSDGAKEAGVGFMKRPCLFVVMDDLKVIPMTTTSSIEYLQKLEEENVELDDLVEIRKRLEALNLLRASLTSDKAAFTRSLFYLLKKWKCQRCIPFYGVYVCKKKRSRKKKVMEEKESER